MCFCITEDLQRRALFGVSIILTVWLLTGFVEKQALPPEFPEPML